MRTSEKVYQAVVDHCDLYGYSPSVSELASEVGVSRSGIHYHLHKLRESGLVSFVDGEPRTVRPVGWSLTDAGVRAVGA